MANALILTSKNINENQMPRFFEKSVAQYHYFVSIWTLWTFSENIFKINTFSFGHQNGAKIIPALQVANFVIYLKSWGLKSILYKSYSENPSAIKISTIGSHILCRQLRWNVLQNIFVYLK